MEAEKYAEVLKTELELINLIHKINQEEACSKDFPNWDRFKQEKYYLRFSAHTNGVDWACLGGMKVMANKFYCYRNFIEDATITLDTQELNFYFMNV